MLIKLMVENEFYDVMSALGDSGDRNSLNLAVFDVLKSINKISHPKIIRKPMIK